MSFAGEVCQTLCKPIGKVAFARGEEHYRGVALIGWRIEEEGVVCVSEGVTVVNLLFSKILSFVRMRQSH